MENSKIHHMASLIGQEYHKTLVFITSNMKNMAKIQGLINQKQSLNTTCDRHVKYLSTNIANVFPSWHY